MDLTPQFTYLALLVVQAIHLFHHRLVKRHISFAECLTGLVLIYQPSFEWVPAWAVMSTHVLLILVQIIGSVWIKRLSPDWQPNRG
jgi:hypothetical protein